jgi:TatD DNase family protein
MIIDTHSHVYLDVFKEDLSEVVERAKSFEVGKVLLPNIDEASIEPMLALCKDYPDFFYSMIGLHPCDVNDDYDLDVDSDVNVDNECYGYYYFDNVQLL